MTNILNQSRIQPTNNNITGLITLNLETEPSENIGYYRIMNKNGKPLGQKEKLPIKQGLQYLGLLAGSLEELEIEFYDKEENLLYKGYFDTVNSKLKKEDTTE